MRGRPTLAVLLPTDLVSPLIHLAKVRGETTVINSLIFFPSGLPRLTNCSRSAGVTSTRLGSLLRRMRFSVLR
ncbi:MAG: hypothetical protein A2V98_05005 [Planctomycetes bacterium RBG_16_64_12]|nr:MAG: hypothetical protein A2V98_05005 [Planctomycetes bacterium RBG_16_64_12]